MYRLRLNRIALIVFMLGRSALNAQNPIVDSIDFSGTTIRLVDVVRLPTSKGPRDSGGLANTNILTFANDDTKRLFVNDMRGQIYFIENGELAPEPFLDLTTHADVRLETNSVFQGFTTFAFHPDFAVEGAAGFGKLYTATDESPVGIPDSSSSREPASQHSVLTEWTVDSVNPNRVDPNSRREIWRLAWPSLGHKMDQLAFNPNTKPGDADHGLLYVSLGDGGDTFQAPFNSVDVDRNGQNTTNHFGTLARINPLGNDGTNGNYGIPVDNPFVDNEAFPAETWAYGFRNPHRFSWDRIDLGGDGTMYISDIGQGAIEEVSIGVAGGNYGWSEREGSFVVNHDDQNDVRPATAEDNIDTNYIDPVIQYDHSEGRAIVGGFVMHGPHELNEHYLFGDIRNGRVFAADVNDFSSRPLAMNQIEEILFLHNDETKSLLDLVQETVSNATRADLRFGQGANGEIYILTKQDGYVRQLKFFLPGDLNDDGILDVEDIDQLTHAIATGGFNYDLNADGVTDLDDRRFWVTELRRTWFGDSNLDGEFNSSDLVTVFQSGEYEDNLIANSTWATGDWSGDREFDSSDFLIAFQHGYELGPRGAVRSVPELDSSPHLLVLGMLTAFVFARRRFRLGIF